LSHSIRKLNHSDSRDVWVIGQLYNGDFGAVTSHDAFWFCVLLTVLESVGVVTASDRHAVVHHRAWRQRIVEMFHDAFRALKSPRFPGTEYPESKYLILQSPVSVCLLVWTETGTGTRYRTPKIRLWPCKTTICFTICLFISPDFVH